MTANPQPDTSQALVAGVRAGFDTFLRLISDFQQEGYDLPVSESDAIESLAAFTDYVAYVEALTHDHALIERDHSELRQRYALLADFVEDFADEGNNRALNDKGCVFAYLDFRRTARELLAKLAEGKTG